MLLDTAYRTGFILGSVTISAGNQSGSVTDANFANGTPFYYMISTTSNVGNEPKITFSGTTMTWTATTSGFAGIIYYGFN